MICHSFSTSLPVLSSRCDGVPLRQARTHTDLETHTTRQLRTSQLSPATSAQRGQSAWISVLCFLRCAGWMEGRLDRLLPLWRALARARPGTGRSQQVPAGVTLPALDQRLSAGLLTCHRNACLQRGVQRAALYAPLTHCTLRK